MLWRGLKGPQRKRELWGHALGTTNNEMELTAILQGLLARKLDVPTVIVSDSKYSISCITHWGDGWERFGWRTKTGNKVANEHLIRQIRAVLTPSVSFKWVKGHVGHEYNERADVLAGMGRHKARRETRR